MPTKKKVGRAPRSQVPDWITRYLETGETPADCTPEAAEFSNWFLLAGWYRFDGRQWPDPDTVPHPDRFPKSHNHCDDYVSSDPDT